MVLIRYAAVEATLTLPAEAWPLTAAGFRAAAALADTLHWPT
jgi:hypothetical protein